MELDWLDVKVFRSGFCPRLCTADPQLVESQGPHLFPHRVIIKSPLKRSIDKLCTTEMVSGEENMTRKIKIHTCIYFDFCFFDCEPAKKSRDRIETALRATS